MARGAMGAHEDEDVAPSHDHWQVTERFEILHVDEARVSIVHNEGV